MGADVFIWLTFQTNEHFAELAEPSYQCRDIQQLSMDISQLADQHEVKCL